MKQLNRLVILILVFISLLAIDSQACTTVIAGKKTTVDGSILFAKSEDDDIGEQLDYYWYIPAKIHSSESFLYESGGLKIPQVEHTFGYFWDETPKASFSNLVLNEYGVAFGSNACDSKEDPSVVLEQRGDLINGGIGFLLRFILAERCKTAREAVTLATELINKYGYNGSGRCLNIVDPNEAWQLQMVRGKHYVARRVQDDEVVILSNTYTIREIDMKDTKNFLCSSDIIDYAIRRGWYNPATDGGFDFAKAYADEADSKSKSNIYRWWMLAKLLQNNIPISLSDAENGNRPVSVKPDHKLSVQDLMNIYRNHYENTPLCTYVSDQVSPHFVNRNICDKTTHRVGIIQQRNWLPVEIGCVYWRAAGHPCESVFVPWYLGINKIPKAYQVSYDDPATTDKSLTRYHFDAPDWQFHNMDMNSASCVFRLLNDLGDSKYAVNQKIIREAFDPIEADQLKMQPSIEKKALTLLQKDKSEAIKYLTQYSDNKAMGAFSKAKEMLSVFIPQK
jgi:dipeptidase